jgi:hypothetical protein
MVASFVLENRKARRIPRRAAPRSISPGSGWPRLSHDGLSRRRTVEASPASFAVDIARITVKGSGGGASGASTPPRSRRPPRRPDHRERADRDRADAQELELGGVRTPN